MKFINEQIVTHKKKNIENSNFFKNIALSKLKHLQHGTLRILDENNEINCGTGHEPILTIEVRHQSFYKNLVLGGSIGAAESYFAFEWDCNQLSKLIALFIKNQAILKNFESGWYFTKFFLNKAYHALRSNKIENSKKNIRAHYDLGNNFFKLFLDEKMMYSSAMFDAHHNCLESAQTLKLKTICEKLQLNENDHILEIGTGWGGFAVYAAKNYGCHITTTTISQNQYDYTQVLIKNENLEKKINLIFKDYRELEGQYDKIVSIEMIEAVGYKYYNQFFQVCNQLLKSDGLFLMQAITISDQHFERAKKEVDFIQRYIFPGSCIPSVTALSTAMKQSSMLRIVGMEDIGQDYAKTLMAWNDRFTEKIIEVKKIGYTQEFIRLWNYYFSYCEAGFSERHLSNMQLVLYKGK